MTKKEEEAKAAEEAKAETATKRVKILWKNIHNGAGLVYKKRMIIDMPIGDFEQFKGLSRPVGEDDIAAVTEIDKGVTHEIIDIAGNLSIVEIDKNA